MGSELRGAWLTRTIGDKLWKKFPRISLSRVVGTHCLKPKFMKFETRTFPNESVE